MPDRLISVLLHLYPEEFRARFGPQIEADLYHPDTNQVFAVLDIVRSALVLRLTSPAPYVWTAAILLAALFVMFSASLTARHAYRILQPRFGTDAEIYALLFFGVFITLSACLLLAIHWLQTSRKMTAKCSKSKI